MILKNINNVKDIHNLTIEQLDALSAEVRQRIVQVSLQNGGHIGASLGTVELIVGLLKVFDAQKDKIVFDVGHQAYAYKILTGRNDKFESLRISGGINGFPMPSESEYDYFVGGHAGNAISAGCGFALANILKNDNSQIISVVGDGVMVNGETCEGLNLASSVGKQIIVINDNTFSISESVGSVANFLKKLRKSAFDGKIKCGGNSPFKHYSIDYIGAVDGHDMQQIIKAFNLAKTHKKTIIVHLITSKGKGYAPAEINPLRLHAVPPKGEVACDSFSKQVGITLTSMRDKNDKIVAIAAAMASNAGLDQFISNYPNSFIDVGIAESTALTVAAALARSGFKPYVAIYSTFLQRAYDQLLHDIGLDNLDVTLCVDRAGIVGEDGESHQGIYDVAFLSSIPNITIGCPVNNTELDEMLKWTASQNGVKAIRYPRGSSTLKTKSDLAFPKWQTIADGDNCYFVCSGARMLEVGLSARELLLQKGYKVGVINARFIKPIDNPLLDNIKNATFFVLEDNIYSGSLSMALSAQGYKIERVTLDDCYLTFGKIKDLRKQKCIDEYSIAQKVIDKFNA